MRIVVALIVIIVLGGVLTAAYSIKPTQLSSAQMDEIQSNCAGCHTIPAVSSRNQVHNAHRFLECSTCHSGTASQGENEDEGGPVNTSVCARCHSVPKYSSAAELHDAHSAADCAACHKSETGLRAATSAHSVIRNVGIGLVILGILGLMLNFIIARIRLKKQGLR
jgi:hypothetical protein